MHSQKRLKPGLRAGNFEACKGQVRFEGTVFRGKSQRPQRALNLCRQTRQRRRSIQAGPEHARPFRVREKTEALSLQR